MVAAMHKSIQEGRGLRYWDELFAAIFKKHASIEITVENTDTRAHRQRRVFVDGAEFCQKLLGLHRSEFDGVGPPVVLVPWEVSMTDAMCLMSSFLAPSLSKMYAALDAYQPNAGGPPPAMDSPPSASFC
jgi:hypothetical protein